MKLSDKSRTLPRLHLTGTLLLVTLLTLFLSGFFTWQKIHEHNASIKRIEALSLLQLQQRLLREMSAIRIDIDYTQAQTEVELRKRLVEMVDVAWTTANALYLEQNADFDQASLKNLLVETLRPLRFFDGRGYYFIGEMSGRFILTPTSPELEGQLMPENQDDRGNYIVRGLLEAAHSPEGAGFHSYRWYRPDDAERMADKHVYVRHFAPFDWLIGAGDYTYEWESRLQQKLLAQIRNRRIGETGYTAVIDSQGQVLLSFDSQHLEEQSMGPHSVKEQEAIVLMLEAAAEGGGFIRYLWPSPSTGENAWKTALVEPAGHWDWVLVSSIFEDEVRGILQNEVQAFEASASHNWYTYLGVTLVSLIIALLGSWLFSRWSSGLFRAYHAELSAQREELKRKADELILSESNIRHLAFHDVLTGLANRRLLIDRLQQQLHQNQRSMSFGALLFIDLDNFKTLNDTLGHDKGDDLLRQVAHRICCCVREEDTVARFGGDEFVVMLGRLSLEESEAAARARIVAEKILTTLRQEYYFDGQCYFSTPSIGITLIHDNAIADELLKQADLAMYRAKDAGRNCLYFFDPEMQQALSARAQMESELRIALQQEQLLLYYQPQVNALGELIGAEALVRWQHPQRGLVAPAEFIPVAEASGLILPLGSLVLRQACQQLSIWARTPGLSDLSLSVNISVHQFKQPSFADEVLALVERFQLVPERLKLELTESLLIDDMAFSIERMQFLKQQGVGFALDDFGTGYSSLAYIKQLPLDQLKIDRCFIDGLPEDANDAAITRIIISLAKELNLWVIAEGVETEAQWNFLQAIQCPGYQGYWFGRPVSAAEFMKNALNSKHQV